MKFEKYHAAGNDFILVDEWNEEKVVDKSSFAISYCDRRKGIGADGVIFLQRSEISDLKFKLLQPNGSEADMSGNGMRCLIRFALDKNRVDKTELKVETNSGIREVSVKNSKISVNMGKPKFQAKEVPSEHRIVNQNLEGYTATACNTGVPHVVIFSEDIETVDLQAEAPKIRNLDIFPEGANVNFAEKIDEGFKVRTFERGVEAETLSCGTGSVAVASTARKINNTGEKVKISSKGGDMQVYFEDGEAFLLGSAEKLFEGKID